MRLFQLTSSACLILSLTATGASIAAQSVAARQTPISPGRTPSSPAPARKDSVDVIARLSAEEVENGKIEDVYQRVAEQKTKGHCAPGIIERYKSEVIPLAEKSSFNVTKNKFLFLAYQDIGECYLKQQDFVNAEESFKKVLRYVSTWPGLTDSQYPMNFRQIGSAQMGQERWQAAEESYQKSMSVFDSLIEQAMKSDTELAASLRGSKAISIAYLGIAYLRQGRTADALKTADLAFAEVHQSSEVPARYVNKILELGRLIANAIGDKDAIAKWSQRS